MSNQNRLKGSFQCGIIFYVGRVLHGNWKKNLKPLVVFTLMQCETLNSFGKCFIYSLTDFQWSILIHSLHQTLKFCSCIVIEFKIASILQSVFIMNQYPTYNMSCHWIILFIYEASSCASVHINRNRIYYMEMKFN